MWKQSRLTRTAYVVCALQSLKEAGKSREIKALDENGKIVVANCLRTPKAKGLAFPRLYVAQGRLWSAVGVS